MNPNTLTVVTVAIALVSVILSIFAAAWLNLQQMSKQIDLLGQRFDAKIETVNTRLSSVETRLDKIERQLEAIFKPVLPGRPRE